jgi:hypothetical protein
MAAPVAFTVRPSNARATVAATRRCCRREELAMSILHALGCALKLDAPPTSTIRVQIDDFGKESRTSLGRAAVYEGTLVR